MEKLAFNNSSSLSLQWSHTCGGEEINAQQVIYEKVEKLFRISRHYIVYFLGSRELKQLAFLLHERQAEISSAHFLSLEWCIFEQKFPFETKKIKNLKSRWSTENVKQWSCYK